MINDDFEEVMHLLIRFHLTLIELVHQGSQNRRSSSTVKIEDVTETDEEELPELESESDEEKIIFEELPELEREEEDELRLVSEINVNYSNFLLFIFMTFGSDEIADIIPIDLRNSYSFLITTNRFALLFPNNDRSGNIEMCNLSIEIDSDNDNYWRPD